MSSPEANKTSQHQTKKHASRHLHSHCHSHANNGKLTFAVVINILLTIVQVIGGVLSGSLSLIADALHNLSDAGAIVIAIFARKISAKKANKSMTFGYQRAEIIGTLINSFTLIIVGLYLIYQAISKYFNPTDIDGWIVIWIASIAFVVDIATAILTYMSGAKTSMNIRAAFIHNVSDAMASVAVIIAGILITLYQWYFVDVIATILISVYVLYHGGLLSMQSINILMQAVPQQCDVSTIKNDIENVAGVIEAMDIHVWQLDEHKLFLDCKLTLSEQTHASTITAIKIMLKEKHGIAHSTVETLLLGQAVEENCY